jgi:hypothetical protein
VVRSIWIETGRPNLDGVEAVAGKGRAGIKLGPSESLGGQPLDRVAIEGGDAGGGGHRRSVPDPFLSRKSPYPVPSGVKTAVHCYPRHRTASALPPQVVKSSFGPYLGA